MKKYNKKAEKYRQKYKECIFEHTLRAGNKEADELSTRAILSNSTDCSHTSEEKHSLSDKIQ